jgi:hypothetical protein
VWNTTDFGSARSAAFYDCMKAGIKDCVAVSDEFVMRVFYGNGTQKWSLASQGSFNYEMEAGDFNNDGYQNEFVTIDSAGYLTVYNETALVWNKSLGYELSSVAVGDLDNDGYKDDFAVGQRYSGLIYAFNTTDGKNWYQMWNASVGNVTLEVVIGDLDHDNDDDVVAVNGWASPFQATSFMGNNGSVIWNATDALMTYPTALSIGDLDYDGYKDDVIISSGGTILIFAFNGTYNAKYTSANVGTNTVPFYDSYELKVIDLDDDGWEDDYVAADAGTAGSGGYIWGFDNNSVQLWNYSAESSGTNYIYSMSLDDINDDGFKEIIVADTDYDRIYVLNRTGSLLWRYTIGLGDIPSYGWGSSPATDTSDMNNDGINEIAVASSDGYIHILDSVNCVVSFNDSYSYNMTWNITVARWQATRDFINASTYSYNITCSKGGYETKTSSSTITVGDLPTITWVTPANDNSSIFNGSFQQNITFSDSSLHMLNCSIYSDAAMTIQVWSIQRNLTGNLTYTKNDTIDISTWTDGTYYENCTVTDY